MMDPGPTQIRLLALNKALGLSLVLAILLELMKFNINYIGYPRRRKPKPGREEEKGRKGGRE